MNRIKKEKLRANTAAIAVIVVGVVIVVTLSVMRATRTKISLDSQVVKLQFESLRE